jgi:hypothetical protein
MGRRRWWPWRPPSTGDRISFASSCFFFLSVLRERAGSCWDGGIPDFGVAGEIRDLGWPRG